MSNLTDYVPPFGDTCCNMEAKRSREAFFAPYILLVRPQDYRFLLPESLFICAIYDSIGLKTVGPLALLQL